MIRNGQRIWASVAIRSSMRKHAAVPCPRLHRTAAARRRDDAFHSNADRPQHGRRVSEMSARDNVEFEEGLLASYAAARYIFRYGIW